MCDGSRVELVSSFQSVGSAHIVALYLCWSVDGPNERLSLFFHLGARAKGARARGGKVALSEA